MNKKEFNEAFKLASSNMDLSKCDIDMFNGFALRGFEPVTVDVCSLARLIQWQTFRFDGSIDTEALNEIAKVGKTKFNVVGI